MRNDKLATDLFHGKIKLNEEPDRNKGQKIADLLNDATKTRTMLMSLLVDASEKIDELDDTDQKEKFKKTVKDFHLSGLKQLVVILEKAVK